MVGGGPTAYNGGVQMVGGKHHTMVVYRWLGGQTPYNGGVQIVGGQTTYNGGVQMVGGANTIQWWCTDGWGGKHRTMVVYRWLGANTIQWWCTDGWGGANSEELLNTF